jgi:hypothetical protein
MKSVVKKFSVMIAAAVFLSLAAPVVAQLAAQTATPPATQNTVNTTGPVSSDTTISVGTLAGELLEYLTAAFGSVLASVATYWLVQLAKKAGVEVTQQMSDQLDRTLLNGANDAATKISEATRGQGVVAVKNAIVAGAVAYAQAHRAETIQALGLDPQSGAAVAALKARLATLANDPSVPTPAVLTPAAPPAA